MDVFGNSEHRDVFGNEPRNVFGDHSHANVFGEAPHDVWGNTLYLGAPSDHLYKDVHESGSILNGLFEALFGFGHN